MSLFRREPETPGASRAPVRDATPLPAGRRMATTIAAGSRCEGTISGANEVVIEGELVGNVRVDAVVIVGPSGQVVGELVGRSVQVGGKVRGDVMGRERVELTPSATLEGNVRSPRVVIAEGAFFKGKVEMGEVDPTAEPPRPGKPPEPRGEKPGGESRPAEARADAKSDAKADAKPENRPEGKPENRPEGKVERAGEAARPEGKKG
jgi:cytoskeletal protein CcmA (bactofilin family)